jgi:hypothetical protein
VAKYTSITDKDLGLKDIRKNIAALSKMAIKAGIVESEGTKKRRKGGGSTDAPTIAQYATWNEYGVEGRIPKRPFIRGWTDNKAENIKATEDKIFKKVCEGRWTAEDAIMRLGEFAQDGIKSYIRTGSFTPNADRTIKIKKSSKPLIDTGTMRNSVRYEAVKK